MNARQRPAAKKIVFEPKVPAPAPKQETVVQTEPTAQEEAVEPTQQTIKGVFAPRKFSTPKEFNIDRDEFILNIPESLLTENASIVVFNDGSLGIKSNGDVFECDCSYLGDSIIVDVDEKAKHVGNPEFMLIGYPQKKS